MHLIQGAGLKGVVARVLKTPTVPKQAHPALTTALECELGHEEGEAWKEGGEMLGVC